MSHDERISRARELVDQIQETLHRTRDTLERFRREAAARQAAHAWREEELARARRASLTWSRIPTGGEGGLDGA